jgi:hypothetical protein
MGGRVSHSVVRRGWDQPVRRNRLISATLGKMLQLNRLVQVTGSAFGYWFSHVFCT